MALSNVYADVHLDTLLELRAGIKSLNLLRTRPENTTDAEWHATIMLINVVREMIRKRLEEEYDEMIRDWLKYKGEKKAGIKNI